MRGKVGNSLAAKRRVGGELVRADEEGKVRNSLAAKSTLRR